MKGELRGAVARVLARPERSGGLVDMLPRVLLAAGIIVPILWLLAGKLATLEPGQIRSALAEMPLPAIAAGVALTAISFSAISFYDVIGTRVLRFGMPPAYVVRAGFAATSIGQTLGFGLIVGTAVRWRFYRHYGASPASAAGITAFISVSFMVAMMLLLATSCIAAPGQLALMAGLPVWSIEAMAWAGLLGSLAVLGLCAWQPSLRLGRWQVRPPRFKAATTMLSLTILDVVPAAAVLWVLLPSGSAPDFFVLLPIYLAAMCIGLASNAPGGIGVLEFACLVALPQVPQAEMVAALIAYRAIFYGLPFAIGAAMLLDHEWRTGLEARATPDEDRRRLPRHADVPASAGPGDVPLPVWQLLRQSHRAEAALALSGDKSFLMAPDRRTMMICAEAGNALVSVSDPVGAPERWPDLIDRFAAEARTRMVTPVAYKLTDKGARAFFRRGWRISRIGQEAVIDLNAFSLEGRDRRELRRKCSKVTKTGVELVRHEPGRAPMAKLAEVSDAWLTARGRQERGFSLGSFDPLYLAGFDIIEARLKGETLGFVSLWRSGDGAEWSIDLMRAGEGAPDGTMHALIVEAVAMAREAGAGRLSICAVPLAGIVAPNTAIEHLAATLFANRRFSGGLKGLYRFKQCFRPDWEPIYVATKGRGVPLFGLHALWRLITQPQPKTR